MIALTSTDRRVLSVLAERAGRPDLAEKLLQKKISRAKIENARRRYQKIGRELKEMEEFREKVFCRANGVGELCRKPLNPLLGELAHLDGGIGRRRQKQSVQNCVAEHPDCHHKMDANPRAWLFMVQQWAERHGYPMPERFNKLAVKARYEKEMQWQTKKQIRNP